MGHKQSKVWGYISSGFVQCSRETDLRSADNDYADDALAEHKGDRCTGYHGAGPRDNAGEV